MPYASTSTLGKIDLAERTQMVFQNRSTLSPEEPTLLSCRHTRAAGAHLKARMLSDTAADRRSVEEAFQRPPSCRKGCKERRRDLRAQAAFQHRWDDKAACQRQDKESTRIDVSPRPQVHVSHMKGPSVWLAAVWVCVPDSRTCMYMVATGLHHGLLCGPVVVAKCLV
jgi:hypothetical protein